MIPAERAEGAPICDRRAPRRRRAGVAVLAALGLLAIVGCGSDGGSSSGELIGPAGLARCPTLEPPAPVPLADPDARRCRRTLATAGRAYLLEVFAAKALCRDRLAAGELSGDARRTCQGLRALSDGAIRLPDDAETAQRVDQAGARLAAAVLADCPAPAAAAAGSCATDPHELVGCLTADHWEHVEHLLDQTYGQTGGLPDEPARTCQAQLGAAALRLTADTLGAIGGCAAGAGAPVAGDLGGRCLGAVSDGFFVPPRDGDTARRLRTAEAIFARSAASQCGNAALASLDACRRSVIGATACLRCVARREALLLAAGELGGVPPPAASPLVDWGALRNPILGRDDRRLKDQALGYADGEFVLFASQGFADDDPQAADRGPLVFRSRDLRTWQDEPERIDPQGDGIGSPDLNRIDGLWHLVFQDADPAAPDRRRLFLATSADLRVWSMPFELAPQLFPGESIIDGALTRAAGRFHLAFKLRQAQEPYVTAAATLAVDAWPPAQRMILQSEAIQGGFGEGWGENFQFIAIDGQPRLLATARDPEGLRCANLYTCSHEPFLYTRPAGVSQDAPWTDWQHKTQLRVPYENWNPVMHANTGFLNDWRDRDGFFYLSYAGSLDAESFQRRGHGKIGMARSRDLIHWRVAGDTRD